MLLAGDLDMGHARALLALDGARQIIEAQRDRRQEAERARGREARRARRPRARPRAPPARARKVRKARDITRIEQQLSDALAAPSRSA